MLDPAKNCWLQNMLRRQKEKAIESLEVVKRDGFLYGLKGQWYERNDNVISHALLAIKI
jgi:hypothetical protein